MNPEYSNVCGLTINDAISRIPSACGQRFATIFEHGSVVVWVLCDDPENGEAQGENNR
jgi:hypothetical protein